MREKNSIFIINASIFFICLVMCLKISDLILGTIGHNEESAYEMADWLNNGQYIASSNPRLGWESSKIFFDHDDIVTKSRTYPINRSRNNFRIVVLGDSITEGAFVGANETFSHVLEKDYCQEDCEVINLGVTGYNLFQYAETLRTKGLRLNPDIVLVGFYINDFMPTPIAYNSNNTYLAGNYFHRFPLLDNKISWFLFRHSRTIREIYAHLIGRIVFMDKPVNMSLHDYMMQFRRPGYEQIMEIKKISDSINATMLVAVFPMITRPEEYEYIYIHREMITFLGNNSIEYIDFIPIYNANDAASLRINDPKDIVHPNQKGHRVIAAAIHEKLGSMFPKRN